jgi:iron complex outermembrane recepter protein
MKKILLLLPAIFIFHAKAYLQETNGDTTTVRILSEVIVKGYEQDRSLQQVAAPVSVIDERALNRTSGISILPALNAAPGIRMEERSPGSYRLNVRGSSLRSPFGVRNVKIYLNNIPFTDPGGTSYLNQFSFYNFSSIEILKGPGSSLYGAGTGGVMLINAMPDTLHNQLSALYTRGSYNTNLFHVTAVVGNNNYKHMLSFTSQHSDGYRRQSAMKREVFSWQSRIKASERQWISTHVFYGDLYYQTPGALTLAQYLADPKAARPPSGVFPSAEAAAAAIFQKTFWSGLTHRYQFNQNWENTTAVYGAFSNIKNPAIRNYERRIEPHFGGRSTFSFTTPIGQANFKMIVGGEFQQGDFNIRVFRNNKGNPDSLQTDDEVYNRQAAVFTQAEFIFPDGWIVTGGVSLNNTKVQFTRLSSVPNFMYTSNFDNEFAPRISILKSINKQLSLYGIVSKGYSPPTVAELLPSTSVINTLLKAERGMNYELGARANFFGTRLFIDVNAFYFKLNEAITQRRDASGADFFINAGGTKQKGIETSINYRAVRNSYKFFNDLSFYVSHTYHHFRYQDFKQLNNDYTGKALPGVSPHTLAAGVDVQTSAGLFANISYYYSDRIAMNDANTEYAAVYQLLSSKVGYRKTIAEHVNVELFVSGDNLLNQQYSLGNDINALGNRFYNAAAGVNYQAGIILRYLF